MEPIVVGSNNSNKQSLFLDQNGRLNQRVVTCLKVIVGVAVVGVAISGFILLEKKSPKIAVGLAGGMSMALASLKLINYATKLAPKDENNEAEEVENEKKRVFDLTFKAYKKDSKGYRLKSSPNYHHYYEIYVKPYLGKKENLEDQGKPKKPVSKFTEVERLKIVKKANDFLPKNSAVHAQFVKALAKSDLNGPKNSEKLNAILSERSTSKSDPAEPS